MIIIHKFRNDEVGLVVKIIPSWDQVTGPVDPQDSGHWTARDWDIPLYGIY